MFKGVPDFGALWDVPGCSDGVPGVFWAVPGVFRGVPGCSGFYRHPRFCGVYGHATHSQIV